MNDTPNQPRSRFTLRQLFVVVFVLACLMALVFPALQQSREAARRIKCANNLKQYGLAIHNYHDVYNSLPPAGLWNVSAADPSIPAPGWHLRILPFMESNTVYFQVDFDLMNYAKPNRGTESLIAMWESYSSAMSGVPSTGPKVPLRQITVQYDKCPSDEGDALINGFAQTSYTGSLGSQRTPSADENCNQFLQIAGVHYENLSLNADHGDAWRSEDVSGIFGRMGFDEKLNLGSIKDGTSNVIMVGEQLINCNDHAIYGTGAWHYNGAGNAHASTSVPINMLTTCAKSQKDAIRRRYPFPQCWAKSNWNYSWGFRSRHPGGAQFVFADGSVQFLPDNIDYMVYQYLGGRADGRKPIEFSTKF